MKNNTGIILFIIVAIAIISYLLGKQAQQPIYVQPTAATSASKPSCSSVTQGYYYCWNSGTPNPHHLGHPVAGDHLCTVGELGQPCN